MSLVLLPAMVRTISSTLPALVRVSALLLALGAVATGLTLVFPLIPPEFGFVKFVINYVAVLCFVIGLALIGVAGVIFRRLRSRQNSSTVK
ncbi:MAG: hypothetical protein PVSMB10_07090 [Pseudarthrobacter sp.]